MPQEALLDRTRKAAVRLLKTKLRSFVFEVKKSKNTDGDTWDLMLVVERGFFQGAASEWQEVLQLWNGLDVAPLRIIINEALQQALSETSTVWEDIQPALDSFVSSFSADDLIHAEAPSPAS